MNLYSLALSTEQFIHLGSHQQEKLILQFYFDSPDPSGNYTPRLIAYPSKQDFSKDRKLQGTVMEFHKKSPIGFKGNLILGNMLISYRSIAELIKEAEEQLADQDYDYIVVFDPFVNLDRQLCYLVSCSPAGGSIPGFDGRKIMAEPSPPAKA